MKPSLTGRRHFIAAGAALGSAALPAGIVRAQSWPSKAVLLRYRGTTNRPLLRQFTWADCDCRQ
jgi:hypothetical protein